MTEPFIDPEGGLYVARPTRDTEDPHCAACGDLYSLTPGDEPTEFCNKCAHEEVIKLRAQLADLTEYRGDPNAAPNPWHPMTDPVDLKVIGKLGEETNELGSAIFRCVIQGINEKHPVTGKTNRQWFLEEIADVRAGLELSEERFEFTPDELAFIEQRKQFKKGFLRTWHAQA